MTTAIVPVVVVVLLAVVEGIVWEELNLYPLHYAFFFNTNPALAQECHQDPTCPYKMHLDHDACWGYERDCPTDRAYSHPTCPDDARGWVQTKEDQLRIFYEQGDFGYVKKQRDELKVYCHPEQEGDSILECSDHMRFCRGRNLYIDLRHLPHRTEPVLYHTDVLQHGQVGGHCRLEKELQRQNADQISSLQSWGPEIRHFTSIDQIVTRHSPHCDIWVDKPVYVMKIDATVNMYHHFCDFFNLYAAQHINNTECAFFSDTQILIWTTYNYRTSFGSAFDAFTKNPIWTLNDVSGKRLCFREVMFPLLPRMIFGLYYNTPIIWGCEGSGLFHAFSHHLLHRLGVFEREAGTGDGRVHVTLLSRDTKHRRILNEAALIQALWKDNTYVVRKATYTHGQDLRLQLRQDQWTDVFVGMHGAGLTHILFLPDWAVAFELYNCGDPNCYRDLARLRGIKYMTWEDNSKRTPEDQGHHPQLGAHEKFTNYTFDVAEFLRLIRKAAKQVKEHQGWQKLQSKVHSIPGHQEL